MVYLEQAEFLRRYRRISSVFIILLILAGLFALRSGLPGYDFGRDLFAIIVAVLAFTLDYDPKYLHLDFNEGKKLDWIVRIRWVLAALALVLGIAGTRTLRGAWITLAAVAWLVVVNLVARAELKYRRRSSAVLMPLRYGATDFLLLALLHRAGLGLLLTASLLALAAHLALVIDDERSRWLPPFLLGAGAAFLVLAVRALDGTPNAYTCTLVLFLAAGLGTRVLVRISRERNRRNVAEAVDQLSAFTQETPDRVRELLATSTDILTENWNRSHPDEGDRDALAEWYRQNSLYYLYDLTAFHLRYKHIEFTLDILRLAHGKSLDYGAGNGELALALARLGHRATYFDLEGMTRQFASWRAGREGLPVEFVSDRGLLEKSATKFDTIISLDVLEHLPDLAGELDFLVHMIAPGGTLIVSAPVGATASHPMHLTHQLDVAAHLRSRGLEDLKTWWFRWNASEAMRRKDVFVFRKPAGIATSPVFVSRRQVSQRPAS